MKKKCILLALLALAPLAALHAQDKSVDIDYCGTEISSSLGVGYSSPLSAAIYIPAERAALYEGCTVTAVRAGLAAVSSNFSVFVCEDLSQSASAAQNVGTGAYGWNEVTLDNPYVISGHGFYVGYTATGTNQFGASDRQAANACYVCVGNQWQDYAASYSALCISFTVTGASMPLDAGLEILHADPVQTGSPFELHCAVRNFSDKPLGSLGLTYAVGDGPEEQLTVPVSIASSATDTLVLTLPAFSTEQQQPLSVSLTTFDGQPDAYAGNNTLTTTLESRDYLFRRPLVLEEGTSIHCGWCPRGIVGMHYMTEKYPDTFIGIAVHLNTLGNDPMAANSYAAIENSFFRNGLPSGVVNRDPNLVLDPSTETLQAVYDKFQFFTNAEVRPEAAFTDADSTTIAVRTATTFSATEENASYRLAFVLLEDSVTGYKQANYFAGGGSGEMGGFEDLPQYADVVYDDVARGIWRNYVGTISSVPTSVEKGVPYTYEYSFSVPAGVQRASKLSVVTLLINARTGEIVNAAKVKPAGSTSAIAETLATPTWRVTADGGRISVEGDYDALQVFTTDGRPARSEGLTPGVYLVRLAKGNHISVQKILVR